MNQLITLLSDLHTVSQDCLRYIKLKDSRKEDPKDSGVLGEYYGELETIAQKISSIFDEQNDIDLVANSDLVSGVGRIVEFFSSMPNDEVIQDEDVEELNIPAMIAMAKKQPKG
jgi:hypothetical protein